MALTQVNEFGFSGYEHHWWAYNGSQGLSADSADTSSRAIDWGWNPVGTGPNTLIEVKTGTVTVTVE